MLRQADIDTMRSIQNLALPNVCDRVRRTFVPDGMGGWLPGTPEVLSDIPCRMSVIRSPVEYLRGGVVAGATDKVITLPQGTDVVATDYLDIGSERFEVVGFLSTGEWETALRCLCVVVR
jgi:hypothetical protein